MRPLLSKWPFGSFSVLRSAVDDVIIPGRLADWAVGLAPLVALTAAPAAPSAKTPMDLLPGRPGYQDRRAARGCMPHLGHACVRLFGVAPRQIGGNTRECSPQSRSRERSLIAAFVACGSTFFPEIARKLCLSIECDLLWQVPCVPLHPPGHERGGPFVDIHVGSNPGLARGALTGWAMRHSDNARSPAPVTS